MTGHQQQAWATPPVFRAGSGQPAAARPEDVTRLRQAIADGVLDANPSVEAIRRRLQISPHYARAARAAVLAGPRAGQGRPAVSAPELVSQSVTAEDLRSSFTVNGASRDNNQDEAREGVQE